MALPKSSPSTCSRKLASNTPQQGFSDMASSDFSNSKLPEKLPVVRQTAGFAFVRQEGPDKIVDVFRLIVASLLTL